MPLRPWTPPYVEYAPPRPNSLYVMGVDPCGHAARDHAAFQVLEVSDGEWRQVAVYADHSEPLAFTKEVMTTAERYNEALVVVESNGVGQSILALLRNWKYRRIYYEGVRRPGLTSTAQSLDRMTAILIDSLLDELVLHDEDTVEQLQSYRHDKRMEESAHAELIRGDPSTRRRERHHWDKISALMMATAGARTMPIRKSRAGLQPIHEAPIHSGQYRFDERTREIALARRPPSRWYSDRPRAKLFLP